MNSQDISVYAVGDIIPNRPNPESLFELAMPALGKADILFGQLEASLSDKIEPQRQVLEARWTNPERVSGLVAAGFDVMSFASNHALDCGNAAFLDTIDNLRSSSINVIGVGRNIEEARKPLILDRKGTKVAFLAYCSVLPKGYEASVDLPGCAPMRAHTFYEQFDWQAGTPPKINTWAYKDDLAAMLEDVSKVRDQADIVILSFHWGVHFIPGLIAMYQKEVAHAAIDAGVDLILGHHPHILKGIEVYKGKAIFYSLANFVLPSYKGRKTTSGELYGRKDDPEFSEYAFAADSRKTIIARCAISNGKIERLSYLPVMINKRAQPEVLNRSDERASEVMKYMEWACQDQGMHTKFAWDGDEVVIG